MGMLAVLLFRQNTNDGTQNGKNFIGNNITYSSAVDPTIDASSYSGVFDGTSSYAMRATDASFDFTKGDGVFGVSIKPNVLNTKQTIYFQGSDPNNYHTFYISSSGTLVYSIVTNGAETVHIETPQGLLSTSAWQHVGVIFYEGTYKIFVNGSAAATLTATAIPITYTGNIYVGAGYNFGTATTQNYYSGNMQMFYAAKELFMRFTATLQDMASTGAFFGFYSHTEADFPRLAYEVVLEACQRFSGRVHVMAFPDALNYLKAHGTISSDGTTVTWVQPDLSDYHLQSNSPAIDAGVDVGLTFDYDGNPISGTPDIGPYEYQRTSAQNLSPVSQRPALARH
jgi:hypothetical protein